MSLLQIVEFVLFSFLPMTAKKILGLSILEFSLIAIFLVAMGSGFLFLWNHRRLVNQRITEQKAEQEQAQQVALEQARRDAIAETVPTTLINPSATASPESLSTLKPTPTPPPVSSSDTTAQYIVTVKRTTSATRNTQPRSQGQEDPGYYAQAVTIAQEAYQILQTAQRTDEYSDAVQKLEVAIELLKSVDRTYSNYSAAQAKIREYQAKIDDLKSTLASSGEEFLNLYLDALINQGLEGIDFWCESERQFFSAFYSARSAQVLRYKDQGNEFFSGVRIASSNRGGQPIIKTWTIVGMKGQAITPSPKYQGWCISFIYES